MSFSTTSISMADPPSSIYSKLRHGSSGQLEDAMQIREFEITQSQNKSDQGRPWKLKVAENAIL